MVTWLSTGSFQPTSGKHRAGWHGKSGCSEVVSTEEATGGSVNQNKTMAYVSVINDWKNSWTCLIVEGCTRSIIRLFKTSIIKWMQN